MVEYFSFNFIYFEWEQMLKWAKNIWLEFLLMGSCDFSELLVVEGLSTLIG